MNSLTGFAQLSQTKVDQACYTKEENTKILTKLEQGEICQESNKLLTKQVIDFKSQVEKANKEKDQALGKLQTDKVERRKATADVIKQGTKGGIVIAIIITIIKFL